MRTQGFLAAAAALLLALPATAIAADPLPVGQADGVRLQQTRSGVVFRFSDRATGLYHAIAGRQVELSCSTVEPNDRLGIVTASGFGEVVRAPRRRSPLRLGSRAHTADYCSVALYTRGSAGMGDAIVSVPLTQAGATMLDEREKATTLFGILTWAGVVADRVTPAAYPSPTRVAASRFARAATRAGYPVVALAAPTDTPPARAYGYWSDGRRSAAVVTLSAAGRRLHIDVGPDDEVSTNVIGIILGSL